MELDSHNMANINIDTAYLSDRHVYQQIIYSVFIVEYHL